MVPSFYQTVDTGIISLIRPVPRLSLLPFLLLFFSPCVIIILAEQINNDVASKKINISLIISYQGVVSGRYLIKCYEDLHKKERKE
jgi:hypothetical protein